MSNEEKVI